MAFTENTALFMADFGQACTLAGAAVTAIVEVSSYEDIVSGVITQGPSAMLLAAAAASAAPGQAFVANAVTYTVRQVLQEPPDGAFVRLVLTRA